MHETSLNRVNQLVGNYEWPHAEMNLASLLRLKNIYFTSWPYAIPTDRCAQTQRLFSLDYDMSNNNK